MALHTITLILLTLVMTFINNKLGYIYFLSCTIIGTYYLFLTYKLYKHYGRENNLKIYTFLNLSAYIPTNTPNIIKMDDKKDRYVNFSFKNLFQ